VPDISESEVIAGVYIVTPQVHGDRRGRFVETYRRSWFPEGREMVQGNRSDKQEGAVVGLHYHMHQADYWYVPRGRIRVVLHDLRVGSPTDGATQTLEIGADWGVTDPILSERDQKNPRRADLPAGRRPQHPMRT
jgi:dTDP-4-dehydrorhamnose 3,5-epimerase